jgi:adenylate cyclase
VQYFLTEKEKRHIKSAFQHYVPAKVVEEITENIEKLKLGGEKRELSVLFSDIRGFTTMSETLPPEDLVRLLNTYLTRMTEQVFKHDGLLDKYIGDAIMAVYGAPIHRPDHALLACHTALDMMRELRGLQAEWKHEKRPAIDIGIGINTGTMIVGNMGSVNRFDYTVIGDSVNLGSRIEHLNKEYGTHILISEFTYADVRDKIKAVREVDVTAVRGRGASVRIYELIPDGEYKNLDWLDEFDTAREHFHAGRMAKAKPLFERLAKAIGDPVSKHYLGRIQARK